VAKATGVNKRGLSVLDRNLSAVGRESGGSFILATCSPALSRDIDSILLPSTRQACAAVFSRWVDRLAGKPLGSTEGGSTEVEESGWDG
jgi:hypothetical protein